MRLFEVKQFTFYFVLHKSYGTIPSVAATPSYSTVPALDPGSGASGLEEGSAMNSLQRCQGPTDCGGRRAPCPVLPPSPLGRLAARCATDRRRHVPRRPIIGVLTNRYHGQCTQRCLMQSATAAGVTGKNQDRKNLGCGHAFDDSDVVETDRPLVTMEGAVSRLPLSRFFIRVYSTGAPSPATTH